MTHEEIMKASHKNEKHNNPVNNCMRQTKRSSTFIAKNTNEDTNNDNDIVTNDTGMNCRKEKQLKYIGSTQVYKDTIIGDIGSDLKKLRRPHKKIGNATVTLKKLGGFPWISKKELFEEHKNNWVGAYYEVNEGKLPHNANVIFSHVIEKVKTSENGAHAMKAQICPHGNKDNKNMIFEKIQLPLNSMQ